MKTKQYLLIIQDRLSEGLDVVCQKSITRTRSMNRGELSREIQEFLFENSLEDVCLNDMGFAVNSIMDAGAWALNDCFILKMLKF